MITLKKKTVWTIYKLEEIISGSMSSGGAGGSGTFTISDLKLAHFQTLLSTLPLISPQCMILHTVTAFFHEVHEV